MSKLYSKHNRPKCYLDRGQRKGASEKGNKSSSLNIYQLQGAFWIYISGASLSFVCLVMETILGRGLKYSKRKEHLPGKKGKLQLIKQ